MKLPVIYGIYKNGVQIFENGGSETNVYQKYFIYGQQNGCESTMKLLNDSKEAVQREIKEQINVMIWHRWTVNKNNRS